MRIGALWLAVLTLSGCGSELALEPDDRVRFLAPPEGSRVTLPLVVRWSADPARFKTTGFDGSADDRRGAYAVFLDSAPMLPGRHLDSLADGDRLCETSPGCPDEAWLADHGVHLTTRPELVLRGVPRRGGRRTGRLRRHEVVVVLLDGRGRRIGEGAWRRAFYVREEGGS